MARGKHGQAASVRHEVQSRDAEIAALQRQNARLRSELDATKRRLAEYQTKLGAWSAEQNEVIAQRIREAVGQASAQMGYRQGAQDSTVAYREAAWPAYIEHLTETHGVEYEAAERQVEEELTKFATRKLRRLVGRRFARSADRAGKVKVQMDPDATVTRMIWDDDEA